MPKSGLQVDTTQVVSGRFGMPRMPNGEASEVITGQGLSADPAYAAGGGGGGAPTDADYVVGSPNATLTAELVLGTAVLMRGLAADRPAAGLAGRHYIATDSPYAISRDNGSSWDEIARGEGGIRLAQLLERAHSSLASVGADDHHAQAHKDAHLSGAGDPFAVGDLLVAQAHLTVIKTLVTVSTTSATEADLQSVTLPANTLGATGGLRIRAITRKVSGTETSYHRLYLGATLLNSSSGSGNVACVFDVLVWNTATNAQRCWVLRCFGTGAAATYVTGTEDTTAAVTIKTTGNSGGTNQIDSLMLIVEILERT